MADWYYESEQGRVGPFSGLEIREFAKQGRVKPETLLWKAGLAEPVRASRFTGLAFGPTEPVVPPQPSANISKPADAPRPVQVPQRLKPAMRFVALLAIIGSTSVGAYILGGRATERREATTPLTPNRASSDGDRSAQTEQDSAARATTPLKSKRSFSNRDRTEQPEQASADKEQGADLSWAAAYPNHVTEASLEAQAKKLLGQRVAISVTHYVRVEDDAAIMIGPIPVERSWNPELFTALMGFDGQVKVTCGGVCRVRWGKSGGPKLVIDPNEFLFMDYLGGEALPIASIKPFVGKLFMLGSTSRPDSIATKLCATSWKPKTIFGSPANEIQAMTMRLWFYPNGECKCSDILRAQYVDQEGRRWLGAEYWRLVESDDDGEFGLAMFPSEPHRGVSYDVFACTIDEHGVLKMMGNQAVSNMEWVDATSH